MKKKSPRNPYVLPMTLRNKKQVFHHKCEERGGSKNDQVEYIESFDNSNDELEISSTNKISPLYSHDCDRCIFLGTNDNVDCYYCANERFPNLSSVKQLFSVIGN